MEELIQLLTSIHPLSADLQVSLFDKFQKERIRKSRSILLSENSYDHVIFIESGLLKLCYDIPGGQERIISFLRTGDILGNTRNYRQHLPYNFALVALDDTIIRKLPRNEAEALAGKFPTFHVHLRWITELQIERIEEHYFLLTVPSRQRISRIRSICPWILTDKRIKQYMIADYLGIDRATLSRLNGNKKPTQI
jgi:CRP-like cAMP-binding protein